MRAYWQKFIEAKPAVKFAIAAGALIVIGAISAGVSALFG